MNTKLRIWGTGPVLDNLLRGMVNHETLIKDSIHAPCHTPIPYLIPFNTLCLAISYISLGHSVREPIQENHFIQLYTTNTQSKAITPIASVSYNLVEPAMLT